MWYKERQLQELMINRRIWLSKTQSSRKHTKEIYSHDAMPLIFNFHNCMHIRLLVKMVFLLMKYDYIILYAFSFTFHDYMQY